MKRIVSLILVAVLVVCMGALASGCKGDKTADLLKGKTIRITSWGKICAPAEGSEDGDMILEQIAAAEEKYGCKVEYVVMSDVFTQVMTAASTGQVLGEVIGAKTHRIRELLMKGDYYWSLEELGVDPENEKFNKDAANYATFKGKTYGWWYNPTAVNNFMVMNKTLIERAGAELPYHLVEDKKWTFDEWHKLMVAASDANTGIRGACRGQTFTTMAMHANDTSVYAQDEKGHYYANTDDTKLVEILQMISDWTINDKLIDYAIGSAWDQASKEFLKGTYVTMPSGWSNVTTNLSQPDIMSDEWGILPMPIGPSATEYKKLDAECKAFAIQKAVPLDEAKAIFQFMEEAYSYPLDEEDGMRAKYEAYCPDKESLENMMLMQALPLTLQSEWTEPDVRTYDTSIMSDLNNMAAGLSPIRSTLDSMKPKVQAVLDEHYGQTPTE